MSYRQQILRDNRLEFDLSFKNDKEKNLRKNYNQSQQQTKFYQQVLRKSQQKMELLKKFYECICCIRNAKFPIPYQFQFNTQNPPARNHIQFESNFVKTSKYTWYDFFIKALLLQFKRLANVYFLVISIILTIPQISPLSPVSSWAPLVVVLMISILRQGYQDYQRHVSDDKMNLESTTQVYRDGKFVSVQWSKVLIGDVVKVTQQDFFPADLILLASSTQGGIAFIQTASLDGEKNLKPRNAYSETNQYMDEVLLTSLQGEWIGSVPDKELHKFSSKMVIHALKQPLIFEGDKQLLYRGARLKNTKFVIGLCIYTGKNTKIMINAQSSNIKMSQIQAKVNYILGFILLFQVGLSFITAILGGVFRNQHQSSFYYIDWSKYDTAGDSILMFFVYFVLINTMIPISLIVSIEMVKICQSYFIMKDQLMYSKFRNKYVEVKSASLNEQLGQIQYVFSDKTGTLTMNLMEFKIACIGQQMYGDLALISKDPNAQPQTQKGFHDKGLQKLVLHGQGNLALSKPIHVTNRQGSNPLTFSTKKQLAQEYLQILGLAHQCVAQVVKGNLIYQGPSPDEIALVDAAKLMGFQFMRSTKQHTTIKIKGQQKTVQLLQVFPFNSDRKRMSVIIRQKGLIKMYTKGADSIVKQRLSPKSQLNLDSQLNEFAKIGLRTLLVGMRTISQQEYQTFKKQVGQLPAEGRSEMFNLIVNQLQKGLFLVGATAVLDRLQDDVPQTIRDLIRANIKVWMLTGDKMQTAQNIAKSCRLIQEDFVIFRYEGSEKQEEIQVRLSNLVMQAQQLTKMYKPKALLIQGSDLTPILSSQSGKTLLSQLAKYCQAVVCCRLLPLQKAQVVALVRQKLNKITLAIGDGANDVPMIKTAHIGIGLFGQEGMGAVQSSDYALPQFRMLWRLLLVHGRWNYIRISEMILYFFYKNMIFTIPQYLFAFINGYSGQTLYDDFYITLYNLIFTSIPLVVRAILEQDINFVTRINDKSQFLDQQQSQSHINIARRKPKPLQILKQQQYLPENMEINKFLYRLFPKVYFIGQQNAIFNYTNYFLWLAEGVSQAIGIFLVCMFVLDAPALNQNGYSGDMWLMGLTVFSAAIVVVTFKLSTHTKFWSIFLFIAVSILSLVLYVAYMWISNYKLSHHIVGTTFIAWTTAQCYFVVLLCLVFVLTIDGVVLAIDYHRGGFISKMRQKIDQQRINSDSQFTNTLAITEGLTIKND